AKVVALGLFRMLGGARYAGINLSLRVAGWCVTHDHVGRLRMVGGPQKDAGAIKECVLLVDAGRSHRQIPSVDDIVNSQGPRAGGTSPLVVALFEGVHRVVIAMGLNAFNMTGKIAYQIT